MDAEHVFLNDTGIFKQGGRNLRKLISDEGKTKNGRRVAGESMERKPLSQVLGPLRKLRNIWDARVSAMDFRGGEMAEWPPGSRSGHPVHTQPSHWPVNQGLERRAVFSRVI